MLALALLVTIAPLAISPTAAGDDPVKVTTLMLEGDVLPGVGTVDFINGVQVNDRGDWSVIARMSQPPGHLAVVVNGEVVHEKGDLLGGKPISGFLEHRLTDGGDVVLATRASGAPSTYGLFFDGVPLYLSGEPAAPALGLWTGAVHDWFLGNTWHEKGEIVSQMKFDLPNGEPRSALVRVRVDDAGQIVSESVLMKEADTLPSGLRVTGFQGHRVNGPGQALVHVRTNGPVDHSAIYLDDEPLAQLYGDGYAPGTKWSFMGYGLGLNDAGDWAYMAAEDDPGQTGRIMRNGEPYVSEGDVLPEGGTVFSVVSLALRMDDAGEVLWYGSLAGGSAWCRGTQVLVQEGTPSPTGSAYDIVFGTEALIDMSDDGRFVTFAAALDDGTIGAFLIGPAGSVEPMAECTGNAGSLAWTGGVPESGETLSFEMDGAASSAGLALLHASLSPIAGWPDCGVSLPGIGELLIDIAPPNPVATFTQPWSGAALTFDVPVPAAVEAIGAHVYLQGHFFDPALGAQPHRLTGGLELVIGDGVH